MSVQIVCISDTHGMHDKIKFLPKGDVLVVAGDYSSQGTLQDLEKFNDWLGTLPYKHKLITSGNHDKYAYVHGKEVTKKLFTNATYLEDEEIIIDEIKFYMSPWIVKIGYWHFMYPRGSQELVNTWKKIPTDTDVLVTHMPPAYILDYVDIEGGHVGCDDLRKEVKNRIKPKVHIFGHIHESYGGTTIGKTTFINASICTGSYMPTNRPIVIHVNKEKEW